MRTYKEMFPVHLIEIKTPKGVLLNGYWIGALRPKRVVVWVHGLGSSMFSKRGIASLLAKDLTAVLMFNNRGHDNVSKVSTTRGKRLLVGAAFERFPDCVDDIQGAINFARKTGARKIFLAGHSTGCQKSIYWAYKKKRGVAGIVLLAPVSDYAAAVKRYGKRKVERVASFSRKMIRKSSGKDLLPAAIWSEEPDSPQRFLSLYTPGSVEEIFAYSQKKVPKILRSVDIPLLVLLAGKDEFGDRPAKRIGDWFAEHLKVGDKIVIVPRVKHSFKGEEQLVAREIRRFIAG